MRQMLGTMGLRAFNALCVIMFFLNTFAGILSGIWLLFKGQWRVFLGGFLASFTMPYWWSIVALPGVGLTMLTLKFVRAHKNKLLVSTLLFISGLYDSLLILSWVGGVFLFALDWSSRGSGILIPMLLGGYSVATSPLAYMASYETPDNIRAHLIVLASEVGYILLTILTLLGTPVLYSLFFFSTLLVIETLLITIIGALVQSYD